MSNCLFMYLYVVPLCQTPLMRMHRLRKHWVRGQLTPSFSSVVSIVHKSIVGSLFVEALSITGLFFCVKAHHTFFDLHGWLYTKTPDSGSIF